MIIPHRLQRPWDVVIWDIVAYGEWKHEVRKEGREGVEEFRGEVLERNTRKE